MLSSPLFSVIVAVAATDAAAVPAVAAVFAVPAIPALSLRRTTAGRTRKCLRADTLSRRLYEGGTSHEDQPDRGASAGEITIMIVIVIKMAIDGDDSDNSDGAQ